MNKLLVTSLLLIILMLSACSSNSRTALTSEDFTSKMEKAGFTITDATDQFDVGTVDSVTIATGDNYQIEFYIVSSADQAQAAYHSNKETFEAAKGSSSSYKSSELKNYSYYYLKTNENYYVVSRTDNTFVYVMAAVEYKDEIADILTDLGY